MRILTFVETILVLLALLAATGKVVDGVHEATAATGLVLVLVVAVVLGVASGEFVDEIHDAWLCGVVIGMGCGREEQEAERRGLEVIFIKNIRLPCHKGSYDHNDTRSRHEMCIRPTCFVLGSLIGGGDDVAWPD